VLGSDIIVNIVSKHWNTQWAKKRALMNGLDDIPEDFRKTKLVACIEPHSSAVNLAGLMERCDKIGIPRELRRDTLVGSPPYTLHVDGLSITRISLRHSYFANSILTHLKQPDRPITVLEIGPGFGGLAALLNRVIDIGTYCLVDQRICLDMQAHFLSRACPDLKCMFLLPSDKWNVTPDIVINTHSFVEMDPPEVARYFTKIQESLWRGPINGGSLYSVNLRDWHVSSFRGFPYDRCWRYPILRKSLYAPRYVECLSVRDSSADSDHPDKLL